MQLALIRDMNFYEEAERLTGIKKPEMDAIWQKVKQNKVKLDGCEGPHDFSIPSRKTGELVRDWQCSRCGGTVETTYKHWYELGLKHAGTRKD